MLSEDQDLSPYRGTEPYIFLSYSHKDAAAAAVLIARMKQAGFRLWYDEGLSPGTAWDENIARAILNCGYFIALVSEAYLRSSNCRDELNFARDREKPQLLIYLEDVRLPAGMEMRLGRLLALHKYNYAREEAFYEKVFTADGIGACRERPEAGPAEQSAPGVRRARKKWILPLAVGAAALVLLLGLWAVLHRSAGGAPGLTPGTETAGDAFRGRANLLRQDPGNPDAQPRQPAFGGPYRREQIRSLTVTDSLDAMGEDAWDVSWARDGSVMAWTAPAGEGYALTIGAAGGVSAPEDSRGLFAGYTSLERCDLHGLHTEGVTVMTGMFNDDHTLGSLDLSGFDTSRVMSMRAMFGSCSNLIALDIRNFDFSSVTDVTSMFSGCSNLTNLDLSGFDFSSVTAWDDFVSDALYPNWRQLFA